MADCREGDTDADGHERPHQGHHVGEERQRPRRSQHAQRHQRADGQAWQPGRCARCPGGRGADRLHRQRELGDRVDEDEAGSDGGQHAGGEVEDDDVPGG